ncbi:hypothetical protein HELRODRAFT_115805 [Helobdella robusta]|uniref:Helicase ATP-binding domain-containing protein n=1 Tax=Helobdella robusta TaxID=6412 RepID=T1EGA8_HELRO|nr:hypothetical protein HELRODRAFT_115805 [Helobdella robusta]ESN92450.1 hypothetical protein HELRODRAFT_115805 [Helobdella robusta]
MDFIHKLVNRKKRELNEFNESFHLDEKILTTSYGLTNVNLRSYQIEGVKWLIAHYECEVGSILADEMGLGKTCQTIAFLLYLYNDNGKKLKRPPSIILTPLSVLNNWRNELTRFAPSLKFLVYTADKDERQKLRRKLSNNYNNKYTKNNYNYNNIDDDDNDGDTGYDIILTSYEICLVDQSYFLKRDWLTLVVDEAHRLKNSQSQLHIALKEFTFKHRVLLTGTPIQNNLTELYSLLSFISPQIFSDSHLNSFLKKYENIVRSKDDDLKRLLDTMMLQRLKADVLFDIPSKQEIVMYHSLSSLQLALYKGILSKNTELFNSRTSINKTKLNNVLMQLRKCVCHPYLFNGVEPEPFVSGEHLFTSSGKLLLLHNLLKHLHSLNHKVLLFSQFTSFLDIVQDYLTYQSLFSRCCCCCCFGFVMVVINVISIIIIINNINIITIANITTIIIIIINPTRN